MTTTITIRKTITHLEEVHEEFGTAVNPPIRRCWVAAVVANPGTSSDDLQDLIERGADLGGRLGALALERLGCQPAEPLAYGKGAIVGTNGALEHGAAILHPKLGAPLRALIGQGKALIPSTIKRGAPGLAIDIPLHGADDEWDFLKLDAIEASVPDAPLPDEIVVFVALAHGGRAAAHIGR